MRPTIERIIRDAKALPTVPSVVAQMAAMLDDDSSGAAEFEQVVRPDPSLTANLLKLANSPFFGARRQISSVRQAIAFLGTERDWGCATPPACSSHDDATAAVRGTTAHVVALSPSVRRDTIGAGEST